MNHELARTYRGLRDVDSPNYTGSFLQLHARDRRVDRDEEPRVGSHLFASRRGYFHHGIYAGVGSVIHYRAFACALFGGQVEEVSLARFTNGRTLWVRDHVHGRFSLDEILTRARSRLGERRYHLLTNNCEHFCEWCIGGEARSPQVESLVALPRRLMDALSRAARRLARPRSVDRDVGNLDSRGISTRETTRLRGIREEIMREPQWNRAGAIQPFDLRER